jgi:trans-2,3-dihydro-3-hydroxyanthranilate isomerase
MDVPFALVDAFTDRAFAGNTAGVIARADALSAAQMQRIARELGQTETSFISATTAPGADLALRWFTPQVEVDLCGHATVAAFVCLAAEGRIAWRGNQAAVRCVTRTGTIDVELRRQGNESPTVTIAVCVATLQPVASDRRAVAAAVGLPESALDASRPILEDPAGARLIVPVTRLADLLALAPNGLGMVSYGARHGYRRFTLVCTETEDPVSFVHLRHFAPANGIPEDPVTGTAHAVAAIYCERLGLLPAGERIVLHGEQGHAIGRHGLVTVELHRRSGAIADVRIGGRGTIVARGSIAVPELS